ncbi:hypothetical protein GCM10010409_01970 [Mycolicibacterium diernhoferi]
MPPGQHPQQAHQYRTETADQRGAFGVGGHREDPRPLERQPPGALCGLLHRLPVRAGHVPPDHREQLALLVGDVRGQQPVQIGQAGGQWPGHLGVAAAPERRGGRPQPVQPRVQGGVILGQFAQVDEVARRGLDHRPQHVVLHGVVVMDRLAHQRDVAGDGAGTPGRTGQPALGDRGGQVREPGGIGDHGAVGQGDTAEVGVRVPGTTRGDGGLG